MEALSALSGQTQLPPARRAETGAPRSQTPAKVGSPQISDSPDNPDKSEQPVSRLTELAKSVGDDIRDRVPAGSHLQIILHGESGTFVYRVLDAETGEIVSQYPADQTLRELAFWRDLKGLSVDTSA